MLVDTCLISGSGGEWVSKAGWQQAREGLQGGVPGAVFLYAVLSLLDVFICGRHVCWKQKSGS